MVEEQVIEISVYFLAFLVFAVIWSAIWKAIALWHSARNKQTAWFVVLCILNTIGLLEIIYLAFFQKNKNPKVPIKIAPPSKPLAKKAAKRKK
jgi:divalent metal cation (Fe/Co/Zn/Cd) transporter